eukprot:471672_1
MSDMKQYWKKNESIQLQSCDTEDINDVKQSETEQLQSNRKQDTTPNINSKRFKPMKSKAFDISKFNSSDNIQLTTSDNIQFSTSDDHCP